MKYIFAAFTLAFLAALTAPIPAHAQLEPIPGGTCTGLGIFCTGGDTWLDLALRVEIFVQAAINLVGTAAVIFLIYAGYKYITSTGNEEASAQAKRQIIYAALGIIIAGSAFMIRNAVLTARTNPQAAAGILIIQANPFINMAMFLVGTAAAIFLLYAGFKYITSQGDQDASSQAKRQIVYAIIGIVVAAGARIISGAFIQEGTATLIPGGSTSAGQRLVNLITPVINAVLVLVGVAAAAYVILAGVMYFSSQGDEQQAETAKQQLIYGIVGITIILLSAAIVNFVIRAVV